MRTFVRLVGVSLVGGLLLIAGVACDACGPIYISRFPRLNGDLTGRKRK